MYTYIYIYIYTFIFMYIIHVHAYIYCTYTCTYIHIYIYIYIYCGFACQQKVLKTFPGPDYLRSEDGIVWLWHSLVNLYIWLTISSCYGSIPLAVRLIGRDGALSTLRHSCGFTCQQRALKKFPGLGYLCSEDGIVWFMLALYICIYTLLYILYFTYIHFL